MKTFQLGEQIWMISFEIADDFYLLSKQTITEIFEDSVECEDDFNTFHVAFEDIYPTKAEAVEAMITRLKQLKA